MGMSLNTLSLVPQLIESVKDLKYLTLLQKISLILFTSGAGITTWAASHDVTYTVIAVATFFIGHVHMLLSKSPSDSNAKAKVIRETNDTEIKQAAKKDTIKSTSEDDILNNYINDMSGEK